MKKTCRKGISQGAAHIEFHENDHNDAFIKEVLLRPTKYDLILSVIESANFGMLLIAQYHLIGYRPVNSHIMKESVSFVYAIDNCNALPSKNNLR
jgi:hypothetical protein